jgi:menaquinone-9 beta-reductase
MVSERRGGETMSITRTRSGIDYDVAIVGAGIAGCATASLLGRSGARVALIERSPDPAAYKRVCGHFIQSSAVPVLERLGLLGELERRGGHRGHARVWSRAGWTLPRPDEARSRAGWTRLRPDEAQSLNLRREVLDPLLRERAASTPGVELLAGTRASGVLREGDRVEGLELSGAGGERPLRARVVVAADGRGSRVAKLAGIETRTSPNVRFAYWGYFEGPPALPDGEGVRLWLLEPDAAIVTPTDSGLQMYVAFPHRDHREAFRADPEAALREYFAALPDAPPLGSSTLSGRMVGKLDLTNERRRAAAPGIALVGDAALAADPLSAVGCGFALQSAGWLADELAPALAGARAVDPALRRYRRRHGRRLGGHIRLLDELAANEGRLNPIQRTLLAAATVDRRTGARLAAFASRSRGPSVLLAPHGLARAALMARRARRRPGTAAAAGTPSPERSSGNAAIASAPGRGPVTRA